MQILAFCRNSFNLKRALSVLTVAVFVFVLSTTMLGAYASPSIKLSPTSGPPGTVVSVTGSGYTPNGEIQANLWNGSSAYTFEADAHGDLTTSETVPPVDPGTYQFVITDVSSSAQTTTQFTVTSGSATAAPTTASSTPTPTVPELPVFAVVAVALIVLASAVVAARSKTKKL